MIAALLLALTACGNPPGTACETVGSGFTASHDCRHRCLSRWQVICPDGEPIIPGVCSGAFECTPGSCPDGQVCYHDDDPFDDRSFCVTANMCGELDAEQRDAWEQQSLQRQRDVRAAREEKAARRAAWQAEHGSPVTGTEAQPVPTPKPATDDD